MKLSVIPWLGWGAPVLLAATALVGAVTTATAGSHTVTPDPALEPAIASGRVTGIAFAAHDGHRSIHVHAAVPATGDAVELGPSLPGDDGAPALVATPHGGFLVLASRRGRSGSLIWSQWFDGHRWAPARVLPATDRETHHPALGVGGDRVWAAWVSGDGGGGRERLLAAPWLGGAWGPPELVPSAPGTPGAPAVAVDRDGLPVVVWTARDRGPDTEIWLARRRESGWTSPVRLTDNDVADITPDAGFAGRTLIVAWASFSPHGYHIEATSMDDRGPGGDRQRVSWSPGTAPRVVGGERTARVVWSTPWPRNPDLTEMRSAAWRGDRFGRATPVVRTRNARSAAAPGPRREWLAAWHGDTGIAAAGVTPTGRGTSRLRVLHGSARPLEGARIEIPFPGSYLAFGDSITAGVVRFDGVVSFVEGYPVHLGQMISRQLGQNVIVTERAAPGERTADGLNRLRSVMISDPRKVVLIQEGANDFSNLAEPNDVYQDLLAMTAAVRERDALPLLSTILPRREDGFGGGGNRRIELANDMIRRTPAGVALIVEMHDPFHGNDKAFSDHIHPNADGYVLMAEVWFRALQPVLNSLVQTRDIDDALDKAAGRALRSARGDRLQ